MLLLLIISLKDDSIFHFSFLDFISCNFQYIIIYYWVLKKPENLGYGYIFTAGIITDVIFGLPMGASPLSFLIIAMLATYTRIVTVKITLLTDWIAFAPALLAANFTFFLVLYFNNIEVDDEVFYVPNTFTPDGDGYNEVYGPVLAGMEYWEGLIFNRWGEHIYTINQNNPTWDGKYKGELVQTGVYVVKYVYKPLNGFKKELFTHVNLLR